MYDLWLLQITMLHKVDINLCPDEIMVNVRTTLFTSLKTDQFIEQRLIIILTFHLSHNSIIWGFIFL